MGVVAFVVRNVVVTSAVLLKVPVVMVFVEAVAVIIHVVTVAVLLGKYVVTVSAMVLERNVVVAAMPVILIRRVAAEANVAIVVAVILHFLSLVANSAVLIEPPHVVKETPRPLVVTLIILSVAMVIAI